MGLLGRPSLLPTLSILGGVQTHSLYTSIGKETEARGNCTISEVSRQQSSTRRTRRVLDNPSTDWKEREGVGMEGKPPTPPRLWEPGGGVGCCVGRKGDSVLKGGRQALGCFILIYHRALLSLTPSRVQAAVISGRSLLSHLFLPFTLAIQPTASRKLHSNGVRSRPSCPKPPATPFLLTQSLLQWPLGHVHFKPFPPPSTRLVPDTASSSPQGTPPGVLPPWCPCTGCLAANASSR